MATVSPVSFGLRVPKYSQPSKQPQGTTPVASQSTVSSGSPQIPNQKSALAVLLTSAMICSVAIVNLIRAGR